MLFKRFVVFNKGLINSAFLGGMVALLLLSSNGFASDDISYHLFSESPKIRNIDVDPQLENHLSKELAQCSNEFQEAECSMLYEVAESLTPRLRHIFLGTEDESKNLEVENLEGQVFHKEKGLFEATNELIKARGGLPGAAYQLACMYDQQGLNILALLWSKVAYEFGSRAAEILGKELVLKEHLQKK